MDKKLDILFVTSISPYRSANLGLDLIKSLQEAGHHIDVLTKYKEKGIDANIYAVYDEYAPQASSSSKRRLSQRYPFLKYLSLRHYFHKPKRFQIVNKIESKPPVDARQVADRIEGKYDLVITLFWQSMITTATLKAIYDKLKCPIFMLPVDMFPMTGGCFYFRECKRFMDACGKCPGLSSSDENDPTHTNLLFKKEVYSSIEYMYIGNTWMCEQAKKSPLFDPSLIKRGGFAIDTDTFRDRDKNESKALLRLPVQKRFVLFAGASDLTEERKGFNILVKAVNQFSARLSEEERRSLLLILAGNTADNTQQYFQIDVYNPGFLNTENLALTYAASDVYLSPTIEDAGPTMVNQALLCGTPVVAFQTGVALDLVKTDSTGYLARYNDADDYALGINHMYQMDPQQKDRMSQECRKVAFQENSFAAFATRIEQFYTEYTRHQKSFCKFANKSSL